MDSACLPLPRESLALAVGQIARVRSRQYLVEEVLRPIAETDCTLVRLSCLEDDAQGEPLEVLWEKEVDARVVQGSNWDQVAGRGFDDPHLFSAYLHALRWNCVTATKPQLFQSPYRAGIEVKAYQLEPLRKALLMPRVNLFIADDVGLGKTIEAGLILRELLLRQKVRRTVICCPPSVVRQWRDEMEQRFGLTFVIYDREFVLARRQERGYAVNPWTTHSRFILSQALVRNEEYLAPLRDWLGDFQPGSLLILDEAHNAAPASSGKIALDSKLTRTLRDDLEFRFEHKLFLSATPHNGHSSSFSALLEMLDRQKFCRDVPVSAKLRDDVMVRRLKQDLREIGEDFPERQVIRIELGGLPEDSPELLLARLLQEYRERREAGLREENKSRKNATLLVLTSLQKRLLSSVEAFARTLRVHRATLLEKSAAAHSDAGDSERFTDELGLLFEAPGADDSRAELPEEDVAAEEEALMRQATRRREAAPLDAGVLELLELMAEIAQRARYERGCRTDYLIDWIRRHLCPELGQPGAKWLPRRVLIFTEYADTKSFLEEQLRLAIAGSSQAGERIATFHGGLGEEKREAIKAAFNADPAAHPLRLLIATDAAREGVNLQNYCADLFHFDIPWNPGRMEQRNGRIDRKLQREKVVRCHYFVLPQRAEDRVLDVLIAKTARIRQQLGSLSPLIEKKLDVLFEQGIRRGQESQLEADLEALAALPRSVREQQVEEELEAVRERRQQLKKQVERLEGLLADSRKWIGLDPRHFRDALNASLEILAAPPLRPLDPLAAAADPDGARWVLPALGESLAGEATWATTLDTLRPPRPKDQKEWQWRREAKIRPVVFRDPGVLDAEVVHLHLEQRVVQRLLGRFLAQGFAHNELSRACIVRTDDPVPRVVLLGRLSLYGQGASRLHDEILAAAAIWQDPETRGGALKSLGETAKEDVLRALEEALGRPRPLPDSLVARLKLHAAQDVSELQPHLERRAEKLAERAKRALVERGEREAKDMRQILVEQRDRIAKRRREVEGQVGQLMLEFNKDEQRQLRSNLNHWGRRLEDLESELEDEPQRIRALYGVRAERLEPLGLVYLWPLSS